MSNQGFTSCSPPCPMSAGRCLENGVMSSRSFKMDAQSGRTEQGSPTESSVAKRKVTQWVECGSGARRRKERLPQERGGNGRAPASAEGKVKEMVPHYGNGANWLPMNIDTIYFCCRCPEGSWTKAELQSKQAAYLFLFHPSTFHFCEQSWDVNLMKPQCEAELVRLGHRFTNTSPRHIRKKQRNKLCATTMIYISL